MSRVGKWRKRAEEIRVIAEDMWDPEAKGMMLRMAQDWDNMIERFSRHSPKGRQDDEPAAADRPCDASDQA
jgi:hypothetical protein